MARSSSFRVASFQWFLLLGLAFSESACDCASGAPNPGMDGGTNRCVSACSDPGQFCGTSDTCECESGYVQDPLTKLCSPNYCPPLTIQNGTVSPSGQVVFGSTATYGCNTDFQLDGTGTRTCGTDGTWSGAEPTCVAVAGPCLGVACGGHGACVPNGNSYLCACADGWVGPNCDMPVMCSGLVDPIHGMVVPTSTLPDGVATYSCSSGYRLVGSATTTCQANGTWTTPAPTCEPVACPTLAAPMNGSISETDGTFGESTSYSCDGGYAISGDSTRTCQADGQWSGAAPTCGVANDCSANPCQNGATCTNAVPGPGYSCVCVTGWSGDNCDVPVDCGSLTNPTFGDVSTTATTNGGVATYSCQGGYQLNGNGNSATRTCQPSGSWSGSAPTCDPLSCTASAPTNGSIDNPMPPVGGEVVYSCDLGFVRNGVLARSCQQNLTLAGVAPTCDPVQCTTTAPSNGSVTATSASYNATVSYSCDSGFMLDSGNTTRTCQSDGTFSGAAPTCVPVIGGCSSNPCTHGACVESGANYTCNCTAGWSGTNCDVPVDCGDLTNPNNGNVSYGASTLDNVASYSCSNGYQLNGAMTRSCQSSGLWSGSEPTCDPITCTGLTAPTNGSISNTSAPYPSSVTYACDAGYNLVGNGGLATRACQADTSWSGIAPTCAPVDCGALAPPTNGSVTGATTYSSTATYGCNGGFMLVGSSTTTCTAGGSWSNPAPTCEPIPMPCTPNPCNGGTCTPGSGNDYVCSDCPTGYGGTNCETPVTCTGATAPTNGSVSATMATYQQAIGYGCDPGYDLVGNASRTCQANGTFDGSAPTCAPVTCTGLVNPTNGSVSATSATYLNSVSYTCSAGYSLVGNATRACQADGTWSGSVPSCSPVDCGPLSAPANGSVSAPTTTYQSTATYQCDGGYVATLGDSTRTCQSSAIWSGSPVTCTLAVTGCTPNPCQHGGACTTVGATGFSCACTTGWTGTDCSAPVTCGGATAPTNGSVSAGSATYGNSVTYSCSGGYTLTGSSSRVCQADGSFAGSPPTCTPVTCSGASNPTNGSVSSTSTTYPNSVTYSCSFGYTLAGNGGSSTRSCQADTTFSGTAPTCAPVTCSGAAAPSNGSVSSTTATYPSSITYGCNSGYTLSGTATASCQGNGTFTGPAPTCVPVSCPALTPPTNGSVTAPASTYQSVATYSCDSGYAMSGSSTTTCQANQTWSNPTPTCTLVQAQCNSNPCLNNGTCTPVSGSATAYTCACQPGYMDPNCGTPVTCSSGVSAPTNGSVTATSATYTNSVTYSCDPGYNLSGSGTRTCQANGTFSGSQPTCVAVTCSGATAPTNGTVSAMSVSYPSSITYTCNSGYTMSGNGGSNTRACQTTGVFSGSQPTCTPVNCNAPAAPTNGTVSAPATTYSSTATYSCNTNYTLQGSSTATCQANGTWTAAPTCVYDCGALANPSGGTVTTSPDTLLNATATYACNTNYTMTGSATRTCTSTGWGGSAPTCTALPVYCDVVYRTATGSTGHGTLDVYNNGLAAVRRSTSIGVNSLLPKYGNKPTLIDVPTPFSTSTYPNGWIRLRFNANAAGNAPVAGPVRLIEFFAPVDSAALVLDPFGGSVTLRVGIDAAAGIIPVTTTGCPTDSSKCAALTSSQPSIVRGCQPIATGNASGTTITWDTCSIASPGASTTGTPTAAQLDWRPNESIASVSDTGCVRDMVAWGGTACTATSGFGSCSAAGRLTTEVINWAWDQTLTSATLSTASYGTLGSTASFPEFIIPDTDTHTYLGVSFANAPVVHVECGVATALTCDNQ